MKPILYSANETAFETNGIGVLADAIECRVAEELNGKYELMLRYPIAGIHYDQIVRRAIILAKPDPVSQPQPFRIYRRMPTSKGTITAYARHISYDLSGVMVSPFSASSVGDALRGLSGNAVNECPFTFWTDKSTDGTMTVEVPSAARSLLGGSAGSLLDVFGGEYQFDLFAVKLWNRRGADRGVSVRYGKNLTSLEMDENISGCYTGVYPYWQDTEGQLVQLPDRIVEVPGEFDHVHIMPLDLSMEWQEAPTEAQLRERTEKYISDNDIGTPSVSWKLSYVDLEQTEEYKGKALLERVLLGDTVAVEFPDMGVSASSRVVAADYDGILERYNSVTLGKVKANIADTIAGQNKELADRPSKSAMQVAIEQFTSVILGARGGAVRFLDDDGDGVPDTLYIADNPDPAQAIKVWRFNYEGWGASSHGYNGPFVLGAALDLGIFADFIHAGAITSTDGSIRIDLDTNEIEINIPSTGEDHSLPSKFTFGKSGLKGYGWDLDKKEYRLAFSILPGVFGTGGGAFTSVTSGDANFFIGPSSVEGNTFQVGIVSNDTKIRGKTISIGSLGSTVEFGGVVKFGSEISTINPGKTNLALGPCAQGETLEVPGTSNYDLFGVRLMGDDGAANATVLAYKQANKICGVGGWAGTASKAKQLYFFTASVSGDTWTVEDAGVHVVNFAGGIEAGTRLQLLQVIGII